VRLLATDPTNALLSVQVVEALAASGKYDMAKEIVTKAMAANPGDIALIRLQFLILTSAGDYKPAIQVGEEMAQMDTSLADATYFVRMAALYAADSQPQKAAEAAARGTKKFANNAELWQLQAQTLRVAGQLQQSIAAATRALEIDPKIRGGWMQIAVSYNDLGQPDSAFAALQKARAAGDNPEQIATYALAFGNRLQKTALADSVKTVAAFEKPLGLMNLADTLATEAATKGNAKLLIGVSNFYVAQLLAQSLQASKSCEDARKAEAAATSATINVQAGGRYSPATAGSVLTAVGELLPYLQQSVKNFCK
jgi:tetratricopeptide (TPR) repeat protein